MLQSSPSSSLRALPMAARLRILLIPLPFVDSLRLEKTSQIIKPNPNSPHRAHQSHPSVHISTVLEHFQVGDECHCGSSPQQPLSDISRAALSRKVCKACPSGTSWCCSHSPEQDRMKAATWGRQQVLKSAHIIPSWWLTSPFIGGALSLQLLANSLTAATFIT